MSLALRMGFFLLLLSGAIWGKITKEPDPKNQVCYVPGLTNGKGDTTYNLICHPDIEVKSGDNLSNSNLARVYSALLERNFTMVPGSTCGDTPGGIWTRPFSRDKNSQLLNLDLNPNPYVFDGGRRNFNTKGERPSLGQHETKDRPI